MLLLKRTNFQNNNFQELVKALDLELKIRDGEEHAFYAALNKTDGLQYVIVAYMHKEAVGCGAIREYDKETMEVKRMFVTLGKRGQGIAGIILTDQFGALENNGLAIAAGVTMYVGASNLVPEFQAKRGWSIPGTFILGCALYLAARTLTR